MEKDILNKLKMNSREEAVIFLKSLWSELPQPCPLCGGRLDFLHKKAKKKPARRAVRAVFIADAERQEKLGVW